MIELLVVMGILTALLTLGAIAVNSLRDTRSVQAGHQMLHARISEARAKAMADGRSTGLLLFPDPRTRRTATAIVQFADGTTSDRKMLRYEAWTNQFGYDDAPAGNVRAADQVVHLIDDLAGPASSPNPTAGKPVVFAFQCSRDTQPDTSDPQEIPGGSHWEPLGLSDEVDLVGEMSLLPDGVGAQLVTGDLVGQRYVWIGAIAFDPAGRLQFRSFRVRPGSTIGEMIFATPLEQVVPSIPGRTAGIRPQWGGTQVGFSIYLSGPFNQRFGDFALNAEDPLPTAPAAQLAREAEMETWINDNALPFLVNRFSGQGGLVQ